VTSDTASAGSSPWIHPLPLFPLQAVLFPQGHLHLKVQDPRYITLLTDCQRHQQPLGILCLKRGWSGSPHGERIELEEVGTLALVRSVETVAPDQIKAHCVGGQRFRYHRVARNAQSLWQAHDVQTLADDPVLKPRECFKDAMIALARTVAGLDIRHPGQFPTEDRRFTELGWVANRWSELLPIPLAARQELMALTDPVSRLEIINTFLRQKKLI
jgi:uncharacterized protein